MSNESHYTRNQRGLQIDPRLRTPALRGDLAAINRALDEGADPNLADADGYNPLIFACENNHVDCATRLIEAGARLDCHTNQGRTPLNIAARYGHADMIRVLVAGGAQVNFIPQPHPNHGINEWSPMQHAWDCIMYHGNHAAMSALLAAGADPNQQRELEGHHNWSPLVRAVSYAEYTSLTPSLLRAGASINQPEITFEFQTLNDPERSGSLRPAQRKVLEYLQAVHVAGGFPVYARAHRSLFVGILSRGTRLPADVIPKIVDYWAHLGWYKYTQ